MKHFAVLVPSIAYHASHWTAGVQPCCPMVASSSRGTAEPFRRPSPPRFWIRPRTRRPSPARCSHRDTVPPWLRPSTDALFVGWDFARNREYLGYDDRGV